MDTLMIPTWARAHIVRAAEAYLARSASRQDASLDEVVRTLVAWPVYGDLGGTLLVSADGAVYCQDHNTLEVHLESDPGWQRLAWAAAAEKIPELRELLPARPTDTPTCEACGGTGHVQVTPASQAWCGACSGIGWK
jgi:hypothetical protein